MKPKQKYKYNVKNNFSIFYVTFTKYNSIYVGKTYYLAPDHAPWMHVHLESHTPMRIGIEITHVVNIWEADLQSCHLLLSLASFFGLNIWKKNLVSKIWSLVILVNNGTV